MEPRHERIARIALNAAGGQGLALAGGYAIRAHGMGNRPSGDVDLFTDWRHREHFAGTLATVVRALQADGLAVRIEAQGETFARLAEPDKVELAADWRAHPPVKLEIGPVLHPDDAVANKMCALFARALPRDFLDIDATLTSGEYTRERLLALAGEADPDFDQMIFAQALGVLSQITDEAFEQYSIGSTRSPRCGDASPIGVHNWVHRDSIDPNGMSCPHRRGEGLAQY